MPYVTVGQENNQDINIFFEDHGQGQPVVMIHGYPRNGRSWERQESVLLKEGYRVITYYRRGFGQSSQPSTGYDYDTFTADLDALLKHLNLSDVVLVGFSMGTGEGTRYVAKYGSSRVKKVVLAGPIPPYLLKTGDNPEGVDQSVFDGIMDAIRKDRFAYFSDFLKNFYNTDKLGGTLISDDAVHASFNVAAGSSAIATLACVPAWLTDFRPDVDALAKSGLPVLVIQGEEDRILPIAATGQRLPALIPGAEFVAIKDGPHAINWTHADELNAALLAFLKK